MSTTHSTSGLTRRTALASLGAGGLGLAMLASQESTLANPQAATVATAGHPAVGMWLLMNQSEPLTPTILMLTGDGLAMSCGTVNYAKAMAISPAGYPGGAMGAAAAAPMVFASPSMGLWEATSEHDIHLTLTRIEAGGDGTFSGMITIDSYPVLEADGMSFTDDGLRTSTTARDALLAIVPAGGATAQKMIAHRIGAGHSGFPSAGMP